jgi:hypothetical protein
MNLVTQEYYKGDIVRIIRTGEEVEVLAATLSRVKVKVVFQGSYGPCGWKSEMYSNAEVVNVNEDIDRW